MNRQNPIEHRLLARCAKFYDGGNDPDPQITDLLERRFSTKGDQKNFLVLEGTDGGVSRSQIDGKKKKKKGKKSFNLIAAIGSHDNDNVVENSIPNRSQEDTIHLSTKPRQNKFDPLKTRNEFKTFINSNLKLQNSVSKELRKTMKKNPTFIKQLTVDEEESTISSFYSGRCKKLLKFEDFIEMNLLWQGYIKELLNLKPENSKLGNIGNITNKLTTSEFVGALITVTHSKILGNIGMKGILIWESQFNYIIIVPSYDNWKNEITLDQMRSDQLIDLKGSVTARDLTGGIRIVNKKSSRFKIEVDIDEHGEEYLEFVIIGDRITFKSFDRSNRKFKNKNVNDFFV